MDSANGFEVPGHDLNPEEPSALRAEARRLELGRAPMTLRARPAAAGAES